MCSGTRGKAESLAGRLRPKGSPKADFMDSLICNVNLGVRVLIMYGGDSPLPPSRNPSRRPRAPASSPTTPGTGPSPFPAIDEFIVSRCNEASTSLPAPCSGSQSPSPTALHFLSLSRFSFVEYLTRITSAGLGCSWTGFENSNAAHLILPACSVLGGRILPAQRLVQLRQEGLATLIAG